MSISSFSPVLEIKYHRRRWRIMVGRSCLGAFPTEEAAKIALDKNRSFYEYWSGSASVQAENTEPVVIHVNY